MTLFTQKHTIESKRVHEGGIINLRVDSLKHPDGKTTTREVVEHNGGVVIACQPTEHEIVLVRQYRYSIDREILELPAGRIEKDEPPLPAAQRELTEETGYLAKEWQELSQMITAPGFCNEILYLYRATAVELVEKDLDEDEETDVVLLPLKKAWQLVLSGEIQDAKTIAGLGILQNLQF